MKTKTILLAGWMLTLIILILSWMVPVHDIPRNWGDESSAWTIERGITYLEWARNNHEYYANHPAKCNETTGSAEFNQAVMSEYEQLILWLEGLDD